MRKAQGLPISTIILLIIAVLVLGILVVWFVGGGGKLWGQISDTGNVLSPEDLQKYKLACQQRCNEAKNIVSTEKDWLYSSYCTYAPQNKHCWASDIGVPCSVSVKANGITKTCGRDAGDSETSCTGAAAGAC